MEEHQAQRSMLVSTQAVQRHLVHRESIAEVFVTGHETPAPPGTPLRVLAQWPRSNAFHLSADGRYFDELLVYETFRQACIYASHVVEDVPRDRRFVMSASSLEFVPEALAVGDRPAQVVLDLRRSAPSRHRFVMDVDIHCDGSTAARGRGEFTVLGAAMYDRLRQGRTMARPARPVSAGPSPVPGSFEGSGPAAASEIAPRQVGRHFDRDVLVDRADAPGSLVLRPGTGHPVHFDHPQDHVPGMALIDAARQVTELHCPGGRILSIDIAFDAFVELTETCLVETTVHRPRTGRSTVESRFVQGGTVATTARVTTTGRPLAWGASLPSLTPRAAPPGVAAVG